MKSVVTVLALAFSLSSFATILKCESATYTVEVRDVQEGARPIANYGVNNYMNDGADVDVAGIYVSNRVIALNLTVDRVQGKFEVAASISKDKKSYKGKIFTDKIAQSAKCTLK